MQVRKTWVLNLASLVAVFAFSMPAQAVPGDMNQDGDVDLSDFALFRDCFLGPQNPNLQPGCQNARFDADSDVDLRDLAGFQIAFTGSCPGPLPNDRCQCPIEVVEGTHPYSNVGATTDGPNEPTMCVFEFGNTNVDADIWYCYTATCTGTAMASLCGSDYDTRLAVYAGCGCPTAAPLACSDDDCGTGAGNVQSRVTFAATAGQKYLVRVGGYLFSGVCTLGFCTAGNVGAPCTANAQCNLVDQGDGRLTIGCNVDACANGSGDCFVPSPTQAPGCGDATCCASTCELDQFCCDVTWDATCAGEAQCLCTGTCLACAPGAGSCGVPDATPGCGVDCCNRVCMVDSFCCLTEWDTTCVGEAESMCFLACIPSAGPCLSAHPTPGCNLKPCCQAVCSEDSYCCDTNWDQTCADSAVILCP